MKDSVEKANDIWIVETTTTVETQPLEGETQITRDDNVSHTHKSPEIDSVVLHVDKTQELGAGSFGTVYKGTLYGTEVAVKKITMRRKDLLAKHISDEVLIHSQIRHPNITQLMGYAFTKQALLIVSEFVNGDNLEAIIFEEDIRQRYMLDFDTKIKIALQLIQAIAYLHQQDPIIFHRDVKPSNVLIEGKFPHSQIVRFGH